MAISENGLKLLKFFKDKNYRLGDHAYPKDQQDLFGGDAEACEKAQIELEEAGLLDLGSPRPKFDPSGVRSAGLTREGVRYLQKAGETAT